MKNNFTNIIFFFYFFMTFQATASIYNFSFESIDGQVINLKDFKGKPILIVNTASFCGYTYQYEQLQNLFEKFNKSNLIIIGVPSNDFGNQEFKKNKEVKEFCETKFNVSFILTQISKIKGNKGHPFFQWIKGEFGFLAFPKWNFYKYLFNKNGELSAWFSSFTKPNSEKFLMELEKVLKK